MAESENSSHVYNVIVSWDMPSLIPDNITVVLDRLMGNNVFINSSYKSDQAGVSRPTTNLVQKIVGKIKFNGYKLLGTNNL